MRPHSVTSIVASGWFACMRRLTIAGLIAALTSGAFALVASAQTNRPSYWPGLVNKDGSPCGEGPCTPVLTESYFDVPWTQKLGTFRTNEIDEAILLPYAALPVGNQSFCGNPTDPKAQARCMIETGINSIMRIDRTDTLYNPSDPLIEAAKRCPNSTSYMNNNSCNKILYYCNNPMNPPLPPNQLPCIEVKLVLSMYWNRGNNDLVQRPFGNELNVDGSPKPYNTGLVISDGTTYGPQMPWYMSHYCSNGLINPALNAVCNNDYFSETNDGFNGNPPAWPNSPAAWSVFPSYPTPAPKGLSAPSNHCAEYVPGTTTQLTTCTFVMAGFDLYPVTGGTPTYPAAGQYYAQNAQLFGWFNSALQSFSTNASVADLQRHFPWPGTWAGGRPLEPPFDWGTYVASQAVATPFLGQFSFTGNPVQPTGVGPDHYLYPRSCTPTDLANGFTNGDAATLRQCGLNYELHINGWGAGASYNACGAQNNEPCGGQWPPFSPGDTRNYQIAITNAHMIPNNQYGRTSFLFAGLPGMQLPVSFAKADKTCARCLSVYEQVHNASLFSLYLPIANEADQKGGQDGRPYGDDFYHALLMTNHMESELLTFADGIRGRTLWHNEYRSKYQIPSTFRPTCIPNAPPVPGCLTFPAAFTTATAKAPYHNYTCDGCHVRNGSGIPIKPNQPTPTTGTLDPALQQYMNPTYNPYVNGMDYTFTGVITPMKLVFFDLNRVTRRNDQSVYSDPQEGGVVGPFWANKIMNFYGDSFHVTNPAYSYSWSYGPADANRLVVNPTNGRVNSELSTPQGCRPGTPGCKPYIYVPQQVNLVSGSFKAPCIPSNIATPPDRLSVKNVWPWNSETNAPDCSAVSGTSIYNAIYLQTSGFPQVGFMLLNGKRLGNLGAMEAIPNNAIIGFQAEQVAALGPTIAGEILWNVGTRGGFGRPGVVSSDQKMACTTQTNLDSCWIGRFGWLGDRVSLEDQVANAAFIEMNMTTGNGNGYGKPWSYPVRYNLPNCGPANQSCVNSSPNGNGNLLESDINRMADYARWLGDPTRSEFVVTLPDVIAGENIFMNTLHCDTCHVIDEIQIKDPNDTMLTKVFRDRLATHVSPAYPFLSYLGTDSLMHDMGYLSQVGVKNPGNLASGIRDATTGVVLSGMENYVQKIRTPALKGLRFNRFVTESYKNTTSPNLPACDFLLHDGRACDAIQAAFLHDGPAIKKLKVIEGLNALTPTQLQQLRAFLYSL
jgi:hypothetical protein